MNVLFSPRKQWVVAAFLAAGVLVGCGTSPPVNYYTLMPESDAAPARGHQSYAIEVVPVVIPAQVDQPQMMFRTAQGAIDPRYSDRWTAPLANEIHDALVDGLVRDLDVVDVSLVRSDRDAPIWRIQVDVQRFDSVAGEGALLDATWRIRPHNTPGKVLLCRSVIRAAVSSPEIRTMVAAHQSTVRALAATIAAGISAGGAGAPPSGPEVTLFGCHATALSAGK